MPDTLIVGLVQAGLLGPVVVWFMWRDGKERERINARETRQDERMDRMVEALNHLIRVTGLEVISRPHVAERMKDETRELIAAAEKRVGS